MANNSTPGILTTQEYLVNAFDTLASRTRNDEQHELSSCMLDPTPEVATPHTLDALLTIPLVENTHTGILRASGVRTLEIEIVSDVVPRRKEHVGSSKVRLQEDDDTVINVLATAKFWFNTRRILDVRGKVWADGIDAGIDDSTFNEVTNRNFLLAYLACVAEYRPLGVMGSAELVADISMYNAQSTLKQDDRLDIDSLVRDIHNETGVKVPKSLDVIHTPNTMTRSSRIRLAADGRMPNLEFTEIGVQTYLVDSFSVGARNIAQWRVTDYSGPAPPNKHLVSLGLSSDGGKTVDISFGIDVSQDTYELGNIDGTQSRTAKSAEEARQMVSPLINAVSSLRRYYNATHRDQ